MFNCSEKNGGGVSSWSVYNIRFEGEFISTSNNSSVENNSSSNNNKKASGWDEEESLLDNEDDDNDNSHSQESIYQKRQRDARQAEENRIARKKAEEKRVKDAIARQNRTNEQMEIKAQQDLQDWNNTWDNAQKAAAAERDEKWAKIERERKKEAEEDKRREEEIIRQQRKWEREKAIKDAKTNFMQTLEDNKIPLFYEHPQAFVLCISKINDEEIKIIPVLLYKNSSNQLPYKQDIINTLKKDRSVQ